ncbi:thioesterase II family protein [Streptomyces sp. NPDC003032]
MSGLHTDADLWVRRCRPAATDAPRLVCFPHAGGSATYYYPLAAALAPEIDVLVIQYPGRQDRHREPCVDDLHRLTDHLHEVLAPCLDRPFVFYGHSMGAVLAFEVARRCEGGARLWPAHLVVSGRRAPSRHRHETTHLQDDAGLIKELVAAGGTDRRLTEDAEFLASVLPAVRSDYRAVETYTYRPGPPLTCPVTVLTGTADPKVTLDEARAWRGHGSGEFALRTFTGGHFFIEEHRDAVAGVLADTLRPHIRDRNSREGAR